MNARLLAREAAAEIGALDPRDEPPVDLDGPTRLERFVYEDGTEVWSDPFSGYASMVGADLIERHL